MGKNQCREKLIPEKEVEKTTSDFFSSSLDYFAAFSILGSYPALIWINLSLGHYFIERLLKGCVIYSHHKLIHIRRKWSKIKLFSVEYGCIRGHI